MNDTSPESGDNFDGGGVVMYLVLAFCFLFGVAIGSVITVAVS